VRSSACVDWSGAVPGDDAELQHDELPELDPSHSCYVSVHYRHYGPRPDPMTHGCGYPRGAISNNFLWIPARPISYSPSREQTQSPGYDP
jgi:hypothetical protein